MKRTRAGLLVSLANKDVLDTSIRLPSYRNESESKKTSVNILGPGIHSDLLNKPSTVGSLGSSTFLNNLSASANKKSYNDLESSYLFAGLDDEPDLLIQVPNISSEISSQQDSSLEVRVSMRCNSNSPSMEDRRDKLNSTNESTEVTEADLVELTPIACSTFSAEQNEILQPELTKSPSQVYINTNCLMLNPETGLFENNVCDNADDVQDTSNASVIKTKRSHNQALRLHGKEYHGLVRANNSVTEVKKPHRKMKPVPCSHGSIQVSERSFMCGSVNEEARRDIFEYFWSLSSWEAKKAYILGSVTIRHIIKRRKTTVEGDRSTVKRAAGYDCFLPKDNGVKVKVCRELFLATLDIKKDSFSEWIKLKTTTSLQTTPPNTPVNSGDLYETAAKKYKSASAEVWLDQLAKVPSHYCRASSSRIYVDDALHSKVQMHVEYVDWCKTKSLPFVQRKKFCEVLESNKISIYKPRKDQCDTCISYKEGNLDNDAYQLHLVKKDEAREAKNRAIALASNDHLVCTMDLQSVQLCPKLLVSSQYYKQKLQLHIFTMYINNTKDVHLYAWHEGDGGVTANEFVSCITSFIENYAANSYRRFTLISDGCGYQNRNKVLSSALADMSKNISIEIQQIILEKGHTMMEVDSVHSTLEKCFKPPLYAPVDYINSMRKARPSQPYIIQQLDYTFFKNFEGLSSNYSSIRPGKKTGDPTVNDIRSLLYKNGETYYKLRFTHPEWTLIPQRRKGESVVDDPLLYSNPVKIEKSKFNSLQSLKSFMHRDYHAFYDSLSS